MADDLECVINIGNKFQQPDIVAVQNRLPLFLGLMGTVALPTLDAWLDWSVVIKWYLQGDLHWAEVGMTINVLSGALPGLWLGCVGMFGGCISVRESQRLPGCLKCPLGLLAGLVLGTVGLLVGLSGLTSRRPRKKRPWPMLRSTWARAWRTSWAQRPRAWAQQRSARRPRTWANRLSQGGS